MKIRALLIFLILATMGMVACLPVAPPSAELEIGFAHNPNPEIQQMATIDECNEVPIVMDVRDPSDPSLAVLPRMSHDDWSTLQNFYKLKQSETYGCERAQPGELYWDAYAIEFGCGPSIMKPQWFYEDGTRVTGDVHIAAFLHWPGAPFLDPAWDPRYNERAEVGWSDNGVIGWAYSGDGHIGPDGGPYGIWTSSDPPTWTDRRVGSTYIYDLGFWDNHCTPSPLFKERRKAGTIPPSSTSDWLGAWKDGELLWHVPLIPGMPGGNTDHYQGLGYIDEGGRWIWHAPGTTGEPQ